MARRKTIPRKPRKPRKLRNAEWRFRAFFERAPVGMLICTKAGQFIQTNAAFRRILGWNEHELTGMTFWDITHPDDLQVNRALVSETHRNIRDNFQLSKRYRRKDGDYVWVDLTSNVIRDGKGKVVYGTAVIQDITDRMRAEASLKEMQEHLQHAQTLESVGRLAAGLAHEFNNLLGVIMGYGELHLSRLDKDAPGRSNVDNMLKATRSAASLTGQLLAFARRQRLKLETLNLSTLVTDMRGILLHAIEESIQLEMSVSEHPIFVRVDAVQIQQVVLNLVFNARDSMPHGGRLTISVEGTTVAKDCANRPGDMTPGKYAKLSIADTGAGMDAETRARLFEPFFTTKELGKGTGLGLATTYGVVKQSAGHILLFSEPGEGTRFDVYLPWIEGEERTSAPTPIPRDLQRSRGGETVLVVEDQEMLLAMVTDTLKSAGYNVLSSSDPVEALALLGRTGGPVDVLLTDIVMPGMNGRRLAELAVQKHPGMKVIFMSGYDREIMAHRSPAGETTTLLSKPFAPQDLLHTLEETLGR